MHRKQISFKKTTLTRRIYGKEETRGKSSTTKLNNQTKKPPTTKQKRDITHLDCENKETKLAE